MAIGFDTWVSMAAAKKAADEQEDAIKKWHKRLQQLAGELDLTTDPEWVFVDPLAHYGNALTTNEIALMLGQPGGTPGARGGPLSQAYSIAGGMGYDVSDKNKRKKGIAAAAKAMGYSGTSELNSAQAEWEREQGAWASAMEPTRRLIQQGRAGGYENLAAILQDFPTPTRAGIEAERGIHEDALYAEIARDRQLEDAAIMEAANAYGMNPAGPVGQLAERTTLMREQARADAITRALEIITGQVNAAGGAVSGLQAGLLPAVEASLALGGQQTEGMATLGRNAAAQMNAINQIRSNENMAQEMTKFMAELGFPVDLLLGQNQANMYATQGAIMSESVDLDQDVNNAISWYSSLRGGQNTSQGGGYAGNVLQGGNRSGPATTGQGWTTGNTGTGDWTGSGAWVSPHE